MYVVIEGVDTCGKSTQLELLNKYFPQAIFTKEPGGSVIGESLRDLILFAPQKQGFVLDEYAEFMLFLADRAQHYKEVLEPHKKGLIISDRSLISSIAYAKHIDMDKAIMLNKLILRGILPHLVVILKLDKATLKTRLESKSNDSIESRGIGYMLEIQERLLEATKMLGLPYVELDASLDREAICQKIVSINTINLAHLITSLSLKGVGFGACIYCAYVWCESWLCLRRVWDFTLWVYGASVSYKSFL